jgi:CubicO group peptidase (beta-lactamase class C family)
VFDAFLNSEFKRLALPGLAVVVTQHGQELFAAGYGYCDSGRKKPITPDTMFGIASVTKMVTAIETIRLQEQNQLSLDDSLNQYFPDLNVAADARMQLRHLLSHSAGLPGLPSRFSAVNLQNNADSSGGIEKPGPVSAKPNGSSDAFLRHPRDLPDFINKLDVSTLAPPGTLLNYSNEGFCLLGGIIENLTAEPYQQRVLNSVFRPLNMANSVVGYKNNFSDTPASPLIRRTSEFYEAGIWDAPLFYPAGGIMSSARDLTRLVNVLSDENPYLSLNSRQLLRQSEIAVASRPDTSIGYGYGLEYQHLDSDTTLHWHTGQRAGVSSYVGWLSGPEVGISVLSNTSNAPVAGIGVALIRNLLKRTDVMWPQLSDRIDIEHDNPTPLDINHFQGLYCSKEGFDCQVSAAGSTLFLAFGEYAKPIPFSFIDKQGGIVGDQSFRFLKHRKSDVTPWALALDLRILPLIND